MRKIILYIAASLDGKIARPDDNIDWLESFPNPDNNDYGYNRFLENIDTTLMGNNTYKVVLNMGIEFPYKNKTNYVFSREEKERDSNVIFISKSIPEFVNKLKKQDGKDIWLIGGSEINTLFLNHHLINEIILSTIPIVLGHGIPLFTDNTMEQSFEHDKTEIFKSGIIQSTYILKHE